MPLYKITVVQSFLGQHIESVYHALIDYTVTEPSHVPELVLTISEYLGEFYPALELLLSNQWSYSHYNVHLVLPGLGESLVAAPIFLGTGDQTSTPLPPQIAAQTAVKGFLHSGTSKKFFTGLAQNALTSGSLSVSYQAAFTSIAQAYALDTERNGIAFTPGWMSTAKVDGEAPTVPYFVPFLADSAIARPEVADLGKRKKGRGV